MLWKRRVGGTDWTVLVTVSTRFGWAQSPEASVTRSAGGKNHARPQHSNIHRPPRFPPRVVGRESAHHCRPGDPASRLASPVHSTQVHHQHRGTHTIDGGWGECWVETRPAGTIATVRFPRERHDTWRHSSVHSIVTRDKVAGIVHTVGARGSLGWEQKDGGERPPGPKAASKTSPGEVRPVRRVGVLPRCAHHSFLRPVRRVGSLPRCATRSFRESFK